MKIALLLLMGTVLGAFQASWLTDGGDPQRNNWQKDEKLLSVSSVKDIQLLWKVKLENETRAMHSLLPPLVIGSVDTAAGKKQLAIQAGVSDHVYAIDVETGKVFWRDDGERDDWPGGARQVYDLCGFVGRAVASVECC